MPPFTRKIDMSKLTSTQQIFDEVIGHVSALTRPFTQREEDDAVAALERLASEIALDNRLPEAAKLVSRIAAFPGLQPQWKTDGKHNFASYLKATLPQLREALKMPRPNVADMIWRNAELLRGAFREPEYRRVILPFTILRRLDCLLSPTKDAVLAKYEGIQGKNYDLRMFLAPLTGYPFWNHSRFTMRGLIEAPDSIRDNLEAMVNGFSPNVRRIFEKFSFMQMVDKLQEKGRLFLVVQAFARTPMDTYSVTAHDMGKAFEELLRRFNETSPAGEQYTPRDVIHLITNILFDGDDEALSVPGVIRTMYDQTAGTGGMLSEGEEKFHSFNTNARLRLFGQELEDEAYAICMADMLIRDQDPANIAVGDTLGDDKHTDGRFDYQISNPPYGVEWKPTQEAVEREHNKGFAGRFGPGLPRISDGQMLFQLNALSKMRPFINGEGGGRIGLVHNGSPLFTGDAGSGESEIRRHILEHDYLEAIVAMPTDMFYNTNIATYLWFMSNRKAPERRSKVLLIDASQMGVLMKKNLGKKRFELSEDCQAKITQAFHDFKNVEWKDDKPTSGRHRVLKAKVLDASHFFYRKVTIERPQRMRFDVTQERLMAFVENSAHQKLKDAEDLLTALNQVLGSIEMKSWMSADEFRTELQAAHDAACDLAGVKPSKLKAKQLEVARKFFGVRDIAAEITTNEKGEVIPDAGLRDSEYIPFSLLGNNIETDIAAYFEREVKPHWPDAWVNTDIKDKSCSRVGLVGCEVNFKREFTNYKSPPSRDDIKLEIESMEKRFMDALSQTPELPSYAGYKEVPNVIARRIPKEWSVERVRFLAKLNPGASKPLNPDEEVSFIPMEAVGDDGSLDASRSRVIKDVSNGYTYFEEGDVSIAKITPCFENGKGAVMKGLATGVGFGTTELIVLRPDESRRVQSQWLYYLTQSDEFRAIGEASMLGSGGQKRVPDLFVKDFLAPVPTESEQQSIANFLDTETRRIDSLIDHQMELIESLKRLRTATISEAITGRIDVRDSIRN